MARSGELIGISIVLYNLVANVYSLDLLINYLLGKGGYVFGSVCLSFILSACLSVSNIIQKVMKGL